MHWWSIYMCGSAPVPLCLPQDLKARTKLAVSGQFNALDLNQAPKFGFGCECRPWCWRCCENRGLAVVVVLLFGCCVWLQRVPSGQWMVTQLTTRLAASALRS